MTALAGRPSTDQTKLTVSFTVQNTGTAASGTFAWTAYLSPDANVADAVATLLQNPSQASLDPTASFSRSVTVTLPSGLTAGTYYVLLQLPSGVTASSGFSLAPTPNLVLQGLSGPATIPPAGGAATVSFTVANTGAGPAGASHVGLYVSADTTLGSGDVQVAEVAVGSIPAGGSVPVQVQVTFPALPPEHVYLLAHANDVAGDGVTETRTDDNLASQPLTVLAPDLIVRSLTGPTSVQGLGASATLNFTIGNQGTQDVSIATQWSLYIAPTATTPTGATPFAQGTVSPIAAGGSAASVAIVVQLPLVQAGQWCVFVQADSAQQVAESDEGNNWGHTCITVLTAIDLAPSAFTAPASASFLGAQLPVSVTVANSGNAPSGDTYLGLYLSRDATFDASDTQLALVPVASIGAFSSTTVSQTVTLPPEPPGSYTLFAVADATGLVTEVNESNNTVSRPLAIVAPNLVPSVTQPAAQGGASASVGFSIGNGGTDAAPASSWAVYLSGDAQLSADDVQLGTGSVGALAPGASASFSPTLALPPTIQPGPHCLLVVADPANAVAESNEADNVAASCFTAVAIDTTPPTTTASVDAPATLDGWNRGTVTVHLAATDDTGVRELHYVLDGVGAVVSGAAADVAVSGDGAHTLAYWAVDVVGNAEQQRSATVQIDTQAPTVSCSPPAVAWQRTDVTVPCTASDGGSGLAAAGDASFSLATSVPDGSEDAAAPTGSRQVCDVAGNCATAGPFAFEVDKKAPQVSCAPPDSQPWHAADVTFTCTVTDGGSGPAESSFTLSTREPAGHEDAAAPTDSRQACDLAGNCTAPISMTAGVDEKPPTVTCPSADAAWHAADVSFSCAVSDGGSGTAASSVTLTAQAPADAETTAGQTGSAQVCDLVGNCSTAGPITGVRFDTKPPAVTCQQPDGAWHAGDVSLTCTGTDGGSGMAGSGTITLTASVPAGVEDAAALTGAGSLCDLAGNCTPAGPLGPVKLDRRPPTVSCPAADSAWHADNVTFTCTATDGGSGPATQTLSLSTTVPAGTEAADAATGTAQACDAVGNCAPAGPIGGVHVDREPPTITIAAPSGTITVGAAVAASYACADGGSGVAACAGPVANGAPIDTSRVGTATFAVAAADAVGNAASASTTYTVDYGVCVPSRVPPGPVGGPTVRVWVVPCDAAGAPVRGELELTAVGVDGGPLPRRPGEREFHREPFGYRYDLDGGALAPGTHTLQFRIEGDPVLHSVAFTVSKSKPRR